jgi:hypothetical protein
MADFSKTLEALIDSDEFESAVQSSTTAGFGGSGYSVELFEDGTWRVLWDNQIGNLYSSSGIILGVPQFDQDTVNDMQEYGDDADLSFALGECAEGLREKLAEKLERVEGAW